MTWSRPVQWRVQYTTAQYSIISNSQQYRVHSSAVAARQDNSPADGLPADDSLAADAPADDSSAGKPSPILDCTVLHAALRCTEHHTVLHWVCRGRAKSCTVQRPLQYTTTYNAIPYDTGLELHAGELSPAQYNVQDSSIQWTVQYNMVQQNLQHNAQCPVQYHWRS